MPRVPSRSHYDPTLDVWMHTGENAVEVGSRFRQGHLATDIETPGLDRAFEINCVTFAWTEQEKTHTILLDPARDDQHAQLCRDMYARASMIILHNAPFDVPSLHHHELLELHHVSKIVDTLVLARYGWPDQMVRKGLGALAKTHLGMEDNAEGMKLAFKAAGYRTIAEGYEKMDIDSSIYRQGAMLDTVATLRLQPILREHCWEWSLNHPFETYGATTHAEAEALLEVQEMVHRRMLKQAAKGMPIDMNYLDEYAEKVSKEKLMAEAELAVHGLEGGMGKGAALVRYLDEIGELPRPWPRTPKGALRATKDDLDALDHPIARAQRTLAEIEKITGYLEKVAAQGATTGRCHPQVGTLAASSTGRMSYSSPELQQFSKHARKVLRSDNPDAAQNCEITELPNGKIKTRLIGPDTQLWSVDWSQIEPITMGIMAKDEDFLAPYEAGADLYEPLMRAAGINRDMAKVGLLADMYGQGEAGMAKRLGLTIEQAGQIRRQIRAAMKLCTRWMAQVQGIASTYGKIVTASGRILPVDQGGIFKSVNYIVQGSAYDVLARSICEIERAGLGDTIRLAMHDELVFDATAEEAVELQAIMTSAPPFFAKWLGREPILRSDRAPMGAQWLKV